MFVVNRTSTAAGAIRRLQTSKVVFLTACLFALAIRSTAVTTLQEKTGLALGVDLESKGYNMSPFGVKFV